MSSQWPGDQWHFHHGKAHRPRAHGGTSHHCSWRQSACLGEGVIQTNSSCHSVFQELGTSDRLTLRKCRCSKCVPTHLMGGLTIENLMAAFDGPGNPPKKWRGLLLMVIPRWSPMNNPRWSAAQPKQLAIPVLITNSTVALPMVLRTLAIS